MTAGHRLQVMLMKMCETQAKWQSCFKYTTCEYEYKYEYYSAVELEYKYWQFISLFISYSVL